MVNKKLKLLSKALDLLQKNHYKDFHGGYIMKHQVKLLITTAVLFTPTIFGNSSVAFREEQEFHSCQSSFASFETESSVAVREGQKFYSPESFIGEDTESYAGWGLITDEDAADARKMEAAAEAAKKSDSFQRALAQHTGSAAYKALYPKMKTVLWMELNKLLNGTGTFAMTADGQKIPVLRGSFDGVSDLVLNTVGVSSTIRSGISLATTISGHKGHIEKELKRLLGFDSLEKFVERLAQEIVLKSMGFAVESYFSTERSLTLSEIGNVQQSVSSEDGRAELLSDKAKNANLKFATGYAWYELKNIINKVVSTSIDRHLADMKVSGIRSVQETLSFVTLGGSLLGVAGMGLTGVISAAGIWAVNHLYGADVAKWGYEAFEHGVMDGLLGASDIAALPISKEEIQEFHARAVTVYTVVDHVADAVIVNEVKESSHGSRIILGAAKNTTTGALNAGVSAVSSTANAVFSTAKRLTSWFVR